MDVSVPRLSKAGKLSDTTVSVDAFKRRGKRVLLREYAVMAEARKRVGTHSAKTRSEISGTTARMYRQKGTGNARHGSRKAPQLRGGGMAFAKKPRDYGWSMPKRARRAALEAALRGKLEDGEVRIVEQFGLAQPRTKDFISILGALDVTGTFLVVPAEHEDAVWRSCRNVPGATYLTAANLNAYEVMRCRYLILEEGALKALEERFGNG